MVVVVMVMIISIFDAVPMKQTKTKLSLVHWNTRKRMRDRGKKRIRKWEQSFALHFGCLFIKSIIIYKWASFISDFESLSFCCYWCCRCWEDASIEAIGLFYTMHTFTHIGLFVSFATKQIISLILYQKNEWSLLHLLCCCAFLIFIHSLVSG